jgi:hypothetical protein
MREEMEQRFYRLGQFLGCYLHQDWPEMHGTPGKAVDAAISEYPTELRQQVRHELTLLLEETADDIELRSKLNEGLGVCIHFKNPSEARAFAEDAAAKLMLSIKRHFDQSRKGDYN